jgi:hypothetical protein
VTVVDMDKLDSKVISKIHHKAGIGTILLKDHFQHISIYILTRILYVLTPPHSKSINFTWT